MNPGRQLERIPGQHDISIVAGLTLLTSAGYYGLQEVLWRLVEPFDSSHLLQTRFTLPWVRWDALHFLAIAKNGYQYEQQVAFQPGWQGVLHLLGRSLLAPEPNLGGEAEDQAILCGALVLNTLLRVLANVYLYKLTKHLFGSRRTALLTCVLYAFPPAPAVLSAPYTETPYAFLTFAGFYALATHRWLVSALAFALATSVRATGVFTTIPLAYALLVAPLRSAMSAHVDALFLTKRVLVTGILCVIVVSPFLAFQAWTWNVFCTLGRQRPWCTKHLPFSYNFVQAEYWNIGLFKYWTPAQLPNFILAAPVLAVSLNGIWAHFTTSSFPSRRTKSGASPFQCGDAVSAIVMYQLLMDGLLIFTGHIQIALRLAPTDPVLWWTLAGWLGRLGKGEGKEERGITLWVWWVCLWGAASLALWTGHYPPA